MLDAYLPTGESFTEPTSITGLYLVFKYSSLDLAKAMNLSEGKLDSNQVKALTYNLLCAVKYLHTANIQHRDLKASNILVNTSLQVKICDFGLARSIAVKPSGNKKQRPMSPSCFTRYYRPPEVILGQNDYDQRADIWSLGCMLAEIYQLTVQDQSSPLFLSDSCYPMSPMILTQRSGDST